jgi:hypothetical protein
LAPVPPRSAWPPAHPTHSRARTWFHKPVHAQKTAANRAPDWSSISPRIHAAGQRKKWPAANRCGGGAAWRGASQAQRDASTHACMHARPPPCRLSVHPQYGGERQKSCWTRYPAPPPPRRKILPVCFFFVSQSEGFSPWVRPPRWVGGARLRRPEQTLRDPFAFRRGDRLGWADRWAGGFHRQRVSAGLVVDEIIMRRCLLLNKRTLRNPPIGGLAKLTVGRSVSAKPEIQTESAIGASGGPDA